MPAENPAQPPKMALRVLTATTFVGMVVFNILANALPLFGRGTGEVSALYSSVVTPAGYVFAIWGVIYLGMLAYSAAQFISPLANDPLPDRLAWPLIVSNLANMLWLVLWHSLAIGWTVPVMLVLLASLIAAYRIARAGRAGAASTLELRAVRVPISIYLGWISVASIANISGALGATEWNRWGLADGWWGAIVLVVGAALALTALARKRDIAFAAVFVWAFAGIAVATPEAVVRTAAIGLAVVIGIGIVVSALARPRLAATTPPASSMR